MSKLRFNKKKHQYSVKNKVLTSVTQWIHFFFAEFDAKAMAKRLASFPVNKVKKKGVKFWLNEWKQSSIMGSLVHKEIEEAILTKHMDKYPFTTTRAKNALTWLNSYIKDLDNVRLYPEVVIYNERLGLAGTIDLLLLYGNNIVIVDWKTNKAINTTNKYNTFGITKVTKDLEDINYNHYTLQLNTYKYLLSNKDTMLSINTLASNNITTNTSNKCNTNTCGIRNTNNNYYNNNIYNIYNNSNNILKLVHLEEYSITVYDIPDVKARISKMLKFWKQGSIPPSRMR